jgi:hypothetical protein
MLILSYQDIADTREPIFLHNLGVVKSYIDIRPLGIIEILNLLLLQTVLLIRNLGPRLCRLLNKGPWNWGIRPRAYRTGRGSL